MGFYWMGLFAHTGIKYLNIEASNLKVVWGAHKAQVGVKMTPGVLKCLCLAVSVSVSLPEKGE